MSDIKPTFGGEMQLAGWSQTHNGGSRVTFWLPDDEAMEPFKLLTARKGNRAGQRFAVVMVEIGDDEMPVDHTEDVLDIAGGTISDLVEQLTAIGRSVLCSAKIGSSPNGAALPMASDQVADAGKPIKTAQSDLVKWAGVLSNDEQFWEYVGTMHPVTPKNAEEAAIFIRRECYITSRSELAHDARAAGIFRSIMRQFDEWSKK